MVVVCVCVFGVNLGSCMRWWWVIGGWVCWCVVFSSCLGRCCFSIVMMKVCCSWWILV